MNNKLHIILLAIFTISCNQNINYLRGSYYNSGPFWTYTFEFLDSINFKEKVVTDDEPSKISIYGTYQIVEDKLILNYNIHANDKNFIYNKIDSSISNSESQYLNIKFVETYSEKPLFNGIVDVIDANNGKLLRSDTTDINGNLKISLSKDIQYYTLKIRYFNINQKLNANYYPTTLFLNSKYNYDIQINTVLRSNPLFGTSKEYKILNLDSNNLEIENLIKPKKLFKYSKK